MDEEREQIERVIGGMASVLGIALSDEMRPNIRLHFEIAARMAAALADFPLDDREEPAPVYLP